MFEKKEKKFSGELCSMRTMLMFHVKQFTDYQQFKLKVMETKMSYVLEVHASNGAKLVEEKHKNLEDLEEAMEVYHETIKRECWVGAYIIVSIDHLED